MPVFRTTFPVAASAATVLAEITELDPERRFSWHGTVGGDRFFSGTREFEIDPRPDGTVQVTHVET